MKLGEIFSKASRGVITKFNPFVVELHELNVGSKINVYLCADTEIKMYLPKEKPTIRILNKNKDYFIRESAEQFYDKVFETYYKERSLN